MNLVLLMLREGSSARPFAVRKDVVVIGRREDCDLRIAVGDVSRKHCKLIVDDQSVRVEDLGSSNGTYVNGERVQHVELVAGDTLQIGPVAFIIQIDSKPPTDELQPILRGMRQPHAADAGPIDDDEALEILDSNDSNA
jgi:pSer/pThr/pTyr-binding forkhead associated (FHA) protein